MHLSPMVLARVSGPAMPETVPDPFHTGAYTASDNVTA